MEKGKGRYVLTKRRRFVAGRISRPPCKNGHGAFCQTVFEGMEGHNHENTARGKKAWCGFQRTFQFAKLVVHGNPQSLKAAGCGVDIGAITGHAAADDMGKLAGRGQLRWRVRCGVRVFLHHIGKGCPQFPLP